MTIGDETIIPNKIKVDLQHQPERHKNYSPIVLHRWFELGISLNDQSKLNILCFFLAGESTLIFIIYCSHDCVLQSHLTFSLQTNQIKQITAVSHLNKLWNGLRIELDWYEYINT